MKLLKSLLLLCTLAGMVSAGTLKDGLLTVDGKPFYVLSSWNDATTTIDDVARLGMNTSYRGAPSTEESVKAFRILMRDAAKKNIQLVPYLSYGGAGVIPWKTEAVKRCATLASEPNLLAWYVGDDITMVHLDGIKQTVTTLREEAPEIAVAADYIAKKTPAAKTVFTKYIDIRCQYTYPVTGESLYNYAKFFDDQREFVGDPLWTWVQCFMWGGQGRQYGLSIEDGVGPFPEPEQSRLMAFVAINRGVRGLLFFPHKMLSMQPELAAEVAYVCHEVRLFNDQLAAGTRTFDLAVSDTVVKATAYTYKKSVAVSMAVIKDTYHRWVDDATVKNVTITVPWTQRKMPKAALVRLPDVVDCSVVKGTKPGTVDITVPELEVAGLMLVSANKKDFKTLRKGAVASAPKLSQLAVLGATAQARKVGGAIWQIGYEHLYTGKVDYLPIMRAVEASANAYGTGDHAEAVRAWRTSLRLCRGNLDGVMQVALSRKSLLSKREQQYLKSPYTLFNIPELMLAADPNGKWSFIRDYLVVGPFPLEGNDDSDNPPGKFDFPYGPEKTTDVSATFETVDGTASWSRARATLSGGVNLLKWFGTTEDVLCYARCTVTSPVDTTMTLGLGSNDGVIMWVNGKEVFRFEKGRGAAANQNLITVKLRKGKNNMLAKVGNLGSNWGLFLAFEDKDRILTYSAN